LPPLTRLPLNFSLPGNFLFVGKLSSRNIKFQAGTGNVPSPYCWNLGTKLKFRAPKSPLSDKFPTQEIWMLRILILPLNFSKSGISILIKFCILGEFKGKFEKLGRHDLLSEMCSCLSENCNFLFLLLMMLLSIKQSISLFNSKSI